MSEVLSKLFRKSGLLAIAPVLIFSAFFAVLVTTTQPHGAGACATSADGQATCVRCGVGMTNQDGECICKSGLVTSQDGKSCVSCPTGQVVSGDTCVTPTPTPNPQAKTGCSPQDSAPETNIIYCGLDGTSVDSALNSFKNAYTNGDGHGHSAADLQAIFGAGGFSTSMYTSGKWVVGKAVDKATSPSGQATILVNGQPAVTDLRITSRCPSMEINCSPAANYPALTDSQGNSVSNAHSRDANWFFDKDGNNNPIHSVTTLVHLDANGTVDFAVWEPCANMLLFKPIIHKELSCKALAPDFKQENDTFHYTFTVTANVKNVDTFTYHIDYGDSKTDHYDTTKGETQTVFKHDYKQLDKDQYYVIKATINDQPQVETCQTKIKIPGKPPVNSLACIDLKAVPTDKEKKNYTFTGRVQVNNTTVTSYTFDFGDGVKQTFNTSDLTFSTTHTYADNASKDLVASFTATGPTGTTPLIDLCTAKFSRELIVTGPAGTMSIFALASVGGVALHQFVLRRKLTA